MTATQSRQPVIKCDSVYKIFGDNVGAFLRNGRVDVAAAQAAGCIIGVNNATFEVYEGEILVVMGLSGSGKSTLLRCISRLTEATAGDIYIDGKDLRAMNSENLIELRRSKMGMVFQSFALLPHKTVLENIAFPLQVKGQSTEDSIKRALAMAELVVCRGAKIIFRVSYPAATTACGDCPLAGGGARYLVSGRAFFGVGSVIRREMQDEFLRLQGVLGKTILFITHDFDEALRLADRIAIMKDGVIEQIDTPANIILHPATEYVEKFTNEVPREKVLVCENVMEAIDTVPADAFGTIKVEKEAIIESVAEEVLNEEKPVAVVDKNRRIVGVLRSKTIIHILFGKKNSAPSD